VTSYVKLVANTAACCSLSTSGRSSISGRSGRTSFRTKQAVGQRSMHKVRYSVWLIFLILKKMWLCWWFNIYCEIKFWNIVETIYKHLLYSFEVYQQNLRFYLALDTYWPLLGQNGKIWRHLEPSNCSNEVKIKLVLRKKSIIQMWLNTIKFSILNFATKYFTCVLWNTFGSFFAYLTKLLTKCRRLASTTTGVKMIITSPQY